MACLSQPSTVSGILFLSYHPVTLRKIINPFLLCQLRVRLLWNSHMFSSILGIDTDS